MTARNPQSRAENVQSDLQSFLSRDAILSKDHLDTAKKELHENPQHRAAHILSFKRAVQSIPHITCPDDERIYLAFLRYAKFNHSMAEKRMDNFVTLRTSSKYPQHAWISRPNLTGHVAQEYLKAGVHLPLGFLEDGRFVIVIRLGAWSLDLAPFAEYIKFAVMQIDRLMEDPRVQIKGVVIIFDMAKMTAKHLMFINPRVNAKHVMQYIQILRVKNDLSKAWTRIPGLKDILPREYGGDNDILENIIDKCAREFVEHFNKPLLWDEMKVDESKRPQHAKNRITTYKEVPELCTGMPGTYIQISNDV